MTTLTRRLQPSATDRAFRTLIAEARQDVRALVEGLVSGDLSPAAWHDQMLEVLAQAHAEAGYRGRLRAGDTAPYDRDDVRFGALVAQEEQPFLDGFRRDLEAGRYSTWDEHGDRVIKGDLIEQRAQMYVARFYGTANEALALTDGGEYWVWETEAGETCADCLSLARSSPYRSLPPTLPRMGQTRCLAQCRCTVKSSTGLTTFAPE